MDVFTVGLWVGTGVFLGGSFLKDRQKTGKALRTAFGLGRGMAGNILSILFLVGMILAVLPPKEIATFAARQSQSVATIVSAAFGTITLIPAFIAFPIVGTLVDAGVGVVPAVAFLTTLTMVGVVTFPLERRQFGTRFAIARNTLSFLFAVLIALAMGVLA